MRGRSGRPNRVGKGIEEVLGMANIDTRDEQNFRLRGGGLRGRLWDKHRPIELG